MSSSVQTGSAPPRSSLPAPAGGTGADGPTGVAFAVARAAEAARWWQEQGFRGRKKLLRTWKQVIADDADELAAVMAAETGKPEGDALLEILLALGHLEWAAKHAEKVLRRRKVPSGPAALNQKATLGYEPYGVVGVIGPWNYPVYTPMGSVSFALAAGNAVVLKPSDLTPGTALWIGRKWEQISGGHPVFQVVTGGADTGAALVRSGCGKIAFTGSTETAKKVMAACAESLTPMVAECGGKDAMLVAADADLPAAAAAAVFGGMVNAGQTCAGVERVYVDRAVYEPFLSLMVEEGRALVAGTENGADYGPLTLPGQVNVVAAHIDAALAAGGRAALGGPGSVREGRRIDAVVLTDVPENNEAVQRETFGPVVVVNPVDSMEEAVDRANGTGYGLGASVFSGSRANARELAERLEAGVVTVNSVLGFAAVGALPFGGVKDSGFGRTHGADGLREFSSPKAMTEQRFAPPLDLLRMRRSERDMRLARAALGILHGTGQERRSVVRRSFGRQKAG
ncbi:aldehyde dehydrogenase family protein [Arthrobacter sp. zg-Y1219]|uniref:aldehyde dehydrogenase family protein n=1 Tax=Arthrobacter sp. zg-Y1219 TaxID=3049067 RepID=UPI0024C35F76|nr:aldehyde dehydrogenase family protein [Arthrobacter sp. zg-Y1219]MDK1361468.1 aldehyde dehydrogenase family protein [Arthrobacter sp. zg-Y1219]